MIEFDKLTPRAGPIAPSPLVPEDGLYLRDYGIWTGTALCLTPSRITKKFTRCFQEAWSQIPEQDRTTLTEFWNKPVTKEGQRSPTIVLNPTNLLPYMKAACLWGRELQFDGFVVDRDSSTSIVHIIAHELGHAISYPHGWYNQHECRANDGDECVACECRAYSYMAAWGFDPFHDRLPKRKSLVERFTRC